MRSWRIAPVLAVLLTSGSVAAGALGLLSLAVGLAGAGITWAVLALLDT